MSERHSSIRRGTESDIEAAAAIKVANWADTYRELIPPDVLAPFLDHAHSSHELLESLAAPDAHFLVAEDPSGEVIGFSFAYLAQTPDPWLESLHVAAAARGQGAGTALIREVARAIRGRGRNSMRLGIVKGNRSAARLYERLGATQIGVEPVGWAIGVDHELYRWADLAALAEPLYNPGL